MEGKMSWTDEQVRHLRKTCNYWMFAKELEDGKGC